MSIKLNTLVKDGFGTVAKVIIIDSVESYKHFQRLVQNGSGLYPDLPAEIKAFADEVTVGKVLQEYKDDSKKVTVADIEAAFTAVQPALPPGASGDVGARSDYVMRHDFPALQQFHTKHAMGSLAAPSCLCCGRSTQGVEIGVQHMELPGIVICKPCKDATAQPVQPAQAEQPTYNS